MKRIFFIAIVVIVFQKSSIAQIKDSTHVIMMDTTTGHPVLVELTIVNGDTIRSLYLPDILVLDDVKESKDRYQYYLRRVKKVYPLALKASHDITTYENELNGINKKLKKHKYIKHQTAELKLNFKAMIADMTESEGHVLCKLIYRETGMTVYEIIKKYKNGLTAVSWQTISKLGGADLKLEYNPDNEDYMIEYIVKQISNGEVYVDLHKYDNQK